MWRRASRWMVRWEMVIFILAGIVSIRIPTLFEPYWYGDEGIYLTIGQAINRGVTLYSQIHDNKPPLLYVIAALADGRVFWMKLILLVWMLITTVIFFRVAKRVTGAMALFCTLLFAFLTTNPMWEGNIANAELFFLLPILFGFWLTVSDKNKHIFWGGVAYGIAVLFKVPAIFSAGVWPIVWIWQRPVGWIKKCVWLTCGILLPIAITFCVAYFQNSFFQYTESAWMQNIPYLSSWKPQSIENGNTLKNRAIILVVVIGLVLGFSRKLGKVTTLLGLWMSLDLFAALLSGRPYPHYLIQIVPALCLLVATAVRDSRARWVTVGLIVLVVWAYRSFGFYTYSGIGYYKNYLEWNVGRKSLAAYRTEFDDQVNNNYEIAALVAALTTSDEKIFVWGDQPMIYALSRRLPCGKYIARYHINDFSSLEQTIYDLKLCRPKIIVDFGGLEEMQLDYDKIKKIGEAWIYRLR